MATPTKNLSIKLPMPIWKKVKILAIHHDATLEDIIRDFIEKGVNNRKVENIINEEIKS